MTREQAIGLAMGAQQQFDIPAGGRVVSAERRIIEIVFGAPVGPEAPPPGPVLDRVAWIVTFALEAGSAELAVDDQIAGIIRFRRLRGVACEESCPR